MGLLDKAKGFLNVDGVKIHITQVENPFPLEDTVMKGVFVLSSKTAKTVLSTTVEFYEEETEGEGDQKKTTRNTLGRQSSKDVLYNEDYPMQIAAGETREISFLLIDVNTDGMSGRLEKKGGLLGAVGTAGKFLGGLNRGIVKYYVEVAADVQGTPFDPSVKVEIQVRPGKS